MDRSSTIGVVIPALNEAKAIEAVVDRARQFGIPVVVDDGSSDDTAAIAEAAGADVVRHAHNRGYDQALDSGFAHAADLGCELIITMDADGQHNPELLGEFIRQLRNGADVVIGMRDRRQRFAEHVFAWVARWLWGIRDPLCGMKGYRVHVYQSLGHFDAHGSIGTELSIYAARNGLKVSQIPVKTRDRAGEPRFGRRIVGNYRIFRAMILALARQDSKINEEQR